ncbi:hypothetical protein ACHQM5_024915 [Ranunculus cassubicifolius]
MATTTDLKAVTLSLMEKREGMEIEMNSIVDRLCQNEGPGIKGNLLDDEDFPRSDIDVSAVCADRRHLSELRNDYKDITNKIHENMGILHSERHAPTKPGHVGNTTTSTSSGADVSGVSMVDVGVAFAVVDEIADGSPSAEDGLQLGDQIVKFGCLESCQDLQRLAAEAQANQGREVALIVRRQGVVTNLALTPRPWNGRGLLGCHFQML